MLRYGLRVLPVPVVVATAMVATGLLWLVDISPWRFWPLAGVAVAAVGAGTALLFDEPAASIVDTLPRPLWWRTAARLWPAVLLAGAWTGVASRLDTGTVGRSDVLCLQGVAVILLAAGAGTALRRRGHPTPGIAVGSTILMLLTTVAIVDPVPDLAPLFPYGAEAAWTAARWWWSGTAFLGATVLVASCVER